MPRVKGSTSKTQKDTTTVSTPIVQEAAPAAADKVRSITSGSAARKPGVTKAEAQTNGSAASLQEEIRVRAYELYKERGYSAGNPTEDWLIAEREILQRHHLQSM